MSSITLVWFRQDLRISDNPALHEASLKGQILPIYIVDPNLGEASRYWLARSLEQLDHSLGNHLQIFEGEPKQIILELVDRYRAQGVYWNRCYEPERIQQDSELKEILLKQNLDCRSFNASLLFEPWEILKSDRTPYRVFTPFYQNGCLKAGAPRKPLSAPKTLDCCLTTQTKKSLQVPSWSNKFDPLWNVGEQAAQSLLSNFIKSLLDHYQESRDFPNLDSTSKLSPHLHFGEISPHQIWWSIDSKDNPFLRQLIWREFAYYLLFHCPQTTWDNYQTQFDRFPWTDHPQFLKAWQKGQTGYPIIDAGMRELWQTGTMHNRVRMLVGSFLTKNLLIHWHHGARWFWDCLLDADLANNSMGWQWIAGCGVDASPFFRIFNPTTQSQKFDATGEYIRRFVPELKHLPDNQLFEPWKSSNSPSNYPKPIVDLAASRTRALQCYQQLKLNLDS